MVTPAVKREAVAQLRGAHEMSERRACSVIDCDRMTVRYRSRRPDNPLLRERLIALAKERRRFGYRRLLIFLRREGFVVNHNPRHECWPWYRTTTMPCAWPKDVQSPLAKLRYGRAEEPGRHSLRGSRNKSSIIGSKRRSQVLWRAFAIQSASRLAC